MKYRLIIAVLFISIGARSQTAWTNVGNGLQQRVVAGKTEYRFTKTSPYAPFGITDTLLLKANTSGNNATGIWPISITGNSTGLQSSFANLIYDGRFLATTPNSLLGVTDDQIHTYTPNAVKTYLGLQNVSEAAFIKDNKTIIAEAKRISLSDSINTSSTLKGGSLNIVTPITFSAYPGNPYSARDFYAFKTSKTRTIGGRLGVFNTQYDPSGVIQGVERERWFFGTGGLMVFLPGKTTGDSHSGGILIGDRQLTSKSLFGFYTDSNNGYIAYSRDTASYNFTPTFTKNILSYDSLGNVHQLLPGGSFSTAGIDKYDIDLSSSYTDRTKPDVAYVNTNYIKNQTITPQSASFNISGSAQSLNVISGGISSSSGNTYGSFTVGSFNGTNAVPMQMVRNQADAIPLLILNQANAAGTGDIFRANFNNVNKFKIDYRGVIGINSTLLTSLQSFRTNAAGTASEAFTPATTSANSFIGDQNIQGSIYSTGDATRPINTIGLISTTSGSGYRGALQLSSYNVDGSASTWANSIIANPSAASSGSSNQTPLTSGTLLNSTDAQYYVRYGNNGSGFGGNANISFGNDNSYFQSVNTAGNTFTKIDPLGFSISNNSGFATKFIASGTNTTPAQVSVRNLTGIMALTADVTSAISGETLQAVANRGNIYSATGGQIKVDLIGTATGGLNITTGAGATVVSNFTYNPATGENRIGGAQSYVFPSFFSAGSEAARINLNGNVGIGTTSTASRLTVAGGDIETTGTANGMILTAPNGSRWRVTVSNTGVLTTTSL